MFHLEMAIYFSNKAGSSWSEIEISLKLEGKKKQKILFCENLSVRSIPVQTSHENTILRFHPMKIKF